MGICLATGVGFGRTLDGSSKSAVYLARGESRSELISKLLKMFGENTWKTGISGKSVVLKPNCNSSHAFPGSTHPDTAKALLGMIREAGPADLKIVDRSGMGDTAKVMSDVGITAMASDFNAEVIPYEKLEASEMQRVTLEGGHWSRGVEWPKVLSDADCIIQTCCLKTHQYGGHFTLSLKNSVGMVSKFDAVDSYNYMRELHTSEHQRRMIAEINALYDPLLVVLDGMQCFVDGGPHLGTLKEPGVILASTDRVALDAAGVAILRHYGTTPQVSTGRIFEQEQIARAAELGLGAASAEAIEIITPDEQSESFAGTIRNVLAGG
jgi:uncharacterized protein (DUF362 family)